MKRNLKTYLIIIAATLMLGLFLGAIWHRSRIFPFPQLSAWINKFNKTSELSIPGRWRKTNLTDEQNTIIEQLRSIGYVSGSQPAPKKKNVIIHDKNRAYEGLNLVTSGHGPEAILMDMEGNELHKWSCDILQVWPDFKPGKYQKHPTFWRRVHLMENGDLFAIFEGVGMIKLDKNSNQIWSTLNGAHHDLYVAQNGNIYILTRKAHINKKYNDDKLILEDFICVLDSNGNQLKQISILDVLETSAYAPVLNRLKAWGDILHTNTIELIENDISYSMSLFRKGRLLISILNLDLICLVDFDKGVVWAESDLWGRQHQPTMLYNGNILLLDNTGLKNKSRIIEFDPVTREIHWQYGGIPDEPFFTPSCGSCQRLANGNTLITETDSGRAFEVTQDKTIVWEFLNPHRAGENNELIASLFEVVRLESDFSTDWLY